MRKQIFKLRVQGKKANNGVLRSLLLFILHLDTFFFGSQNACSQLLNIIAGFVLFEKWSNFPLEIVSNVSSSLPGKSETAPKTKVSTGFYYGKIHRLLVYEILYY